MQPSNLDVYDLNPTISSKSRFYFLFNESSKLKKYLGHLIADDTGLGKSNNPKLQSQLSDQIYR